MCLLNLLQVHIGTGLLFMLTWNLFPNTLASRYYAGMTYIIVRVEVTNTQHSFHCSSLSDFG